MRTATTESSMNTRHAYDQFRNLASGIHYAASRGSSRSEKPNGKAPGARRQVRHELTEEEKGIPVTQDATLSVRELIAPTQAKVEMGAGHVRGNFALARVGNQLEGESAASPIREPFVVVRFITRPRVEETNKNEEGSR